MEAFIAMIFTHIAYLFIPLRVTSKTPCVLSSGSTEYPRTPSEFPFQLTAPHVGLLVYRHCLLSDF